MSVQYYDIALKNTTSSGISIPDLSGLYIPSSGAVNITDLFSFDRLISSPYLDTLIVSSGIVLNVNGTDLPVDRAQTFLSYHDAPEIPQTGTLLVQYDRDEEAIILDGINFLSLSDTPTTYSGQAGNSVIVHDNGYLSYGPSTASNIVSSYAPPASGTNNIWFNLNDNAIYYFDEYRDGWLSVVTHTYLYTYNAAISAAFMTVGNVSTHFAHFSFTRPATVVAINAHGDTGNATKGFELIDRNTEYVYKTFYMTNYEYYNNLENVELNTGTELQIFVLSAGQGIKYPIIQLEIKWRYEAP